MSYAVHEIYYSLQGEGFHSGRPAVFCRFIGCNLWSGREEDRETAICTFCDTDFLGSEGPGGGIFATASAVATQVGDLWPDMPGSSPYVVCTGGEPLLQLDKTLVDAFHESDLEVAIETNGTREPPADIDWITVSPKAGTELVVRQGDELKLVFPQRGVEPEQFIDLGFDHFFLQPMDGPAGRQNTELALRYCLDHPRWKLSLQIHKLLNIP